LSRSQDEAKPIDLENLGKVIARLGEALRDYQINLANLYILDSVIKRFELTYELSVRNLRRFLLDYVISQVEVEDMSFQGLIRLGDKEGLLRSGWPAWRDFRDARNDTVHTYHEAKAREIAEIARNFLPEAEHLQENLKRRVTSHG
jgi:nucleotidyltransferase substrate binding protein (TIGR01987 family)